MILNSDQQQVRDAVRDFSAQELWPHAAAWDKEHTFPVEAHKGLAALGAYGICVPDDLGGAGLDYLSLAVVIEEIAAGDGGTSTAISVTTGGPSTGFKQARGRHQYYEQKNSLRHGRRRTRGVHRRGASHRGGHGSTD